MDPNPCKKRLFGHAQRQKEAGVKIQKETITAVKRET